MFQGRYFFSRFTVSQIRTFGVALMGASVSIAAFVSAKLFPIMIEIFGLHGCLLIFCVGSVLGAIFVLFVIDDTAGVCIDDVGLDDKTNTKRIPTTKISGC